MRTMDIRRNVLLGIVLFVVILQDTNTAPVRNFFPYGEVTGDFSLDRTDDTSSSEVQLETPIHFYDGVYRSIFVNSNGLLSFDSELPRYQPTLVLPLGLGIKLIAPFLSDVDLTFSGNVFYRETASVALLQRAASLVQSHFSEFPDFEPSSLFIVTWDAVVAYNSDQQLVNTFQVVIASDEQNSFAIFNYLDDGIQWIRSAGKMAGQLEDPPGQAGFDSGSGRLFFSLPKSGTNDVGFLARDSNVNQAGIWMYHIGNTMGDNIAEPNLNTGNVEIFNPEVDTQTCLQGGSQCHENARCVDYNDGFCCECVPPYYGNGKQCLQKDLPQRLSGKVSGILNDVEFQDLDMHAFVVTKEARAYTAVNRVPPEISNPMMTLNTIGGVIGWMFARPTAPGATNGYMYTGGKFMRSATITYQQGQRVQIEQEFFGHDALKNVRLNTFINGTIPELPDEMKVTVDDYVEEYRRVEPGRIHSTSVRTYRVNEIASQYTWDQTITFEECDVDPEPADVTMRMSVTRNFITYDSNNNVVRYAMTSYMGVLIGSDPCREGSHDCDENARCVPDGDSYTCECTTGFLGDGLTCSDLDECAEGLNTCDQNARCLNIPGSFQCFCNHGYEGDGIFCTPIREAVCGEDRCSQNARCVFNDVENRPMCECNPGYRGNGIVCQTIEFDCNEADICHENAECLYSQAEGRYRCMCVEGFSGDGLYCEETTQLGGCGTCDVNAECRFDTYYMVYRCVCNQGYEGNGSYCYATTDVSSMCDACHMHADCQTDGVSFRCYCKRGYQGNGQWCEPFNCLEENRCDVNAACVRDAEGLYMCECNTGYRGDGFRCEPEGCNVVDNCDTNARCMPDPRDTSRYMCRCNPGYSGDGTVCIRRVVPCNEVDNCSEYAECVYDARHLDYRCRCKNGYEGDGLSCTVRGVDCRRDSRLCDPNASCMLNVDTFVCVCNRGYRGDGTSCAPTREEMNFLLFSRGYSLHKVPYTQDGIDSDGTRVLYVPGELAVGVGTDCEEQDFYWTDVNGGKVSRASLEGSEKVVVATGFSSPEGVAIDWLSRNMYVTDSGLDIIAVVNLNGTYKKTLISEDVVNPRAIVVDPQRGVMYWTDWFRNQPTIEMANMDGSDRKIFVETELGLPNGLTIDYYTQSICWGDAGVNRIECVRSDGVGRRVITEDAPYPFDLAFYGNTIYWSDWTMSGVPSISRDGGEIAEPLSLPIGGNGRLYGIAAVGEYCPRVTNACFRSNGGCSFLCLPTPNGGRTCACPDDIDDETCADIGYTKKRK